MAAPNLYGENDETKLEKGVSEAIEGMLDPFQFIRLFTSDA